MKDIQKQRQNDEVDKKALLMIAIGGIAILAVVVIAFTVLMKQSSSKRDEVRESLAVNVQQIPEQASEAQTEEAQKEEQEPERQSGENQVDETEEGETSGPSQEETALTEQPENGQTQMGAMDDAQDPQNGAKSGNEEGVGAEVFLENINPNETEGLTIGIDVSKYQGTIDWSKVKESGIEFAMIRVGYRARSTGEIFEDPTARYNMQEAQKNGIKLGAYFFSTAVTEEEAGQEAAFTKEIIAKYKITYPVAYNCEDFQSPDSRQNGLTVTERTNLAVTFLDEIAAAGYTPMFYAAKGELEGNALWNAEVLSSKYKIWVAQYPDTPYPETTASSYSGSHDMWQYTSQGSVSGIAGKTDVNVAYFGYSEEAKAKDETPAEEIEVNPEVGIVFTEVDEVVTAKQETNLRTEPSTLNDSSIAGKLVHGDTAQRTGIGHNGWSRLVYNGQTYYAVTGYLTTDMNDTGQQAPPQGPVYTPMNESVTAKDVTNLRTEPSTLNPDTVVGALHNGEVLTRIGIGDNGWSQLQYNGQTVYAVTSYLTTP